jgi:hypothetical protein
VDLTLNPFAFLLLFFWVGIVGVGSLCSVCAALNSHDFSLNNLMPVGFLFLGVGTIVVCFQPEARKSKAFLYDLFEADRPAVKNND